MASNESELTNEEMAAVIKLIDTMPVHGTFSKTAPVVDRFKAIRGKLQAQLEVRAPVEPEPEPPAEIGEQPMLGGDEDVK